LESFSTFGRRSVCGALLVGVMLAGLYWMIEAFTGAFLFHQGDFFQQAFRPSAREIFVRSEVVFLLFLLAFFGRSVAARRREAEDALGQARGIRCRLQARNEELLKSLESAARVAQQAVAADRAKGDFLTMISHEVRTPLNGIVGMTEVALNTDLTAKQRDFLETAKASADSLLQVINDILDFSKMDARELDLDQVSFELRDCLGDTVSALRLLAARKGLDLTYDIRPEVPDAVVGDPGRLRQIMVNLVGNAIKFTERDGVKVRIEHEPHPDGSPADRPDESRDEIRLRFSVIDTGIGIPANLRATIFDAYTQVPALGDPGSPGTGLGLAISRQLVERMGGRIWVESEPGVGTTFFFSVCFGLQRKRRPRQVTRRPQDLKGLPVLVVDENAVSRRILEETLTNWLMDPTVVNDGSSALERLETAHRSGESYVLVILDGKVSGMDGFTLAERIRRHAPLTAAPLIMLKSGGQRGDAARCRDAGIAGYLTKPIRQAELLEAIVTVLGIPESCGEGSELVTRHSLREERRRFHILLAEDDPVSRKAALLALEQTGHNVVVVGDGEEAVSRFEREPFDLVLMDVQMPGMNGLAATEAIRDLERRRGGRIPILAMTGNAGESDREACFRAGMDGCLLKPVTVKTLHETLERFLGPDAPSRGAAWKTEEEPDRSLDLDRIHASMKDNAVCERELLELFISQCQEKLAVLETAFQERDSSRICSVVHGFRGACGNVGANELENIASCLENAASLENLDQALADFGRLRSEWARVYECLKDHLSTPRFAATREHTEHGISQ